MDIDQDIQSFLEGRVHQGIDLVENLRFQQVFRAGPRVVMPANRNPHVIKSFTMDLMNIFSGVSEAPVLPGRHFQPVTQVGSPKEPTGCLVSRGVLVGDPFHLTETFGPESAGGSANRDRLRRVDLQRGGERLVMPGPCVVRSGRSRSVAGLPDDPSPATRPAGGR